jgi:thiol-disulfide isomerase/thioredoxin
MHYLYRTTLVLRLALLLALLTASASAAELVPLTEGGLPRLLAAHKGKVVLVSFWATWCAPCREELPQLIKLEASLRAKGFRLITVSADEPEDQASALAFLHKLGAPSPAYIKRAANDGLFIDAIDPAWGGALPALFLYDRSSRKTKSFIGETDLGQLEAAIRKLL